MSDMRLSCRVVQKRFHTIKETIIFWGLDDLLSITSTTGNIVALRIPIS